MVEIASNLSSTSRRAETSDCTTGDSATSTASFPTYSHSFTFTPAPFVFGASQSDQDASTPSTSSRHALSPSRTPTPSPTPSSGHTVAAAHITRDPTPGSQEAPGNTRARSEAPKFVVDFNWRPDWRRGSPRAVAPSASSNSLSGTAVLTPSVTPSLEPQDSHDRDRPFPWVESVHTARRSRPTTPSTTAPTSTTTPHSEATTPVPDHDPTVQQLEGIRNLAISENDESGTGQHLPSPTQAHLPLISISPSATRQSHTQDGGIGSLVNGVASLCVDGAENQNIVNSKACESSASSPARRRRSGMGATAARYEVTSETLPEAFFYTAEVQEALKTARALASKMFDALGSSTLHREEDSTVRSLHKQAGRLRDFQLPSSRIVGLVGDAGAGKTSLLNSLLDIQYFARVKSNGEGCTCAVTEYRFHERDDFIINIEYFPLEELKQQFEELLRAYRDSELSPPDQLGQADEEDAQRMHKARKLVNDTFQAAFQGRLDRMPTLLSTMPFDQAVDQMVSWASQQLPRHGYQREVFTKSAECSSRLGALTSTSQNPSTEPETCWPLIRKVQVYLNAYILRHGLIIADLPGLRDLNSARKAITERYVRNCHQIFAVAEIDRVVTNTSVYEIFELARRANLSKVDVVCTRAEAVEAVEVVHDFPAKRVTIEELENRKRMLAKKKDELEAERRYYRGRRNQLTREEADDLHGVECEHHEVERSEHECGLVLDRLLTNLRNTKVANGLRSAYQNHPAAASLKVFGVSNHLYRDYRERPEDIALPYLTMSGIPELRRYCIGIVADGHLNATKEYIRSEIPALLGSVRLWVEHGAGDVHFERKQRILEALDTVQAEIDKLNSPISEINDLERSLINVFNREIYARLSRNYHQWAADADQVTSSWHGWPAMTYKAFCSNNGEHTTREKGYHCWNEEAIERMKSDMGIVWEDTFIVNLSPPLTKVDAIIRETFRNISRITTSVSNSCQGQGANAQASMQTLAATIRHREDLVLNGIAEARETFDEELAFLKTNAFSGIRTGYVGRMMRTTYHTANLDFGSGSDQRRKALISDKFRSSDFFRVHRDTCKKNFRKLASELQNKVKEVLSSQIAYIDVDLQTLRASCAIFFVDRHPEFRWRVEAELDNVGRGLERISRVFENNS